MAGRVAHAQTEAVLHSFSGTPDGAQPTSSLALNGGNLYGTTYDGGLGYGTVYEVSPNGSGGWTETTVYSFCQLAACADGENPTYSSLVFDGQGNLYGTAYGGGANGYGVVFELSNSNGTWTESVLHSFANAPNDAANPGSGVIMDGAGNLFGVAFAGGTGNGKGCVFELSPSNGTWTAQVIYDMNSTHTGLTLSLPSTPEVIYGATYTTVFELTPNGTGGWTETALFTFTAADSATEGAEPVGTLALDPSGNLYGATEAGGTNNKGVVYKLTPAATGNWTETVLFSFGGEGQYGPNGATPFAGVILDAQNNIYGATQAGGTKGAGTLYELVAPANPNGAYKEHVFFNFDGENGAEPKSSLVQDSLGYLYGTTYLGGANGDGAVFQANAHAGVTKTTLTASPNPSVQGQAVTFTATVTSSAGTPPPDGENVRFNGIGNAPLVNGVATFSTKRLPVGNTQTSATYGGDINFTSSNSAKLIQVVNQ
ncbi:MAG TPA: Ig-like domain-containing protein [Terriglobales bacterium]|nr:Ig-like domain-containing protein [Terriglobales bacterium]